MSQSWTNGLYETAIDRIFPLTKAIPVIIGLSVALALPGCSGKIGKKNADLFAGQGSPRYKGSGPLPKGGGRRHVGKPYTINGKRFYPKDVASYERTGVASWYGPKFHRRMTSNGEWFDMHDLTAAHTTLPLPSYVKVTNLSNGKEAVLRVNDRGPFAHDRIIDLSKRSSEILGFKGKGTQNVKVVYLGKAPIAHDGTHLAAMNRKHLRSSDYTRVASAMNYPSASRTMFASAEETPEPSAPAPQPVQTVAETESLLPVPVGDNGSYFVQAASFSNVDNAERAKYALGSLGPVSVSPVTVGANTYYRVRVGPLDNENSAYEIADLVREQGMHGAR
ncbi:MAG: septal ring lytic transglycosylase RlpA family protein, partial [Rhizobiales bacterium]|nr:septal ring lytic transglycosylase RlpA family protein [Hyphomicrobiales bacterium]